MSDTPIISQGVTHSIVNGRDIFRAKSRKTEDPTEPEIQYPLRWMKPRISGGSVVIGDGISYQTGSAPSFIGNSFAANNRICLIETLTPVVAYSTFNDGTDDIESFQVESVIRSSYIGVIPSPYQSSPPILKYPSDSESEVLITVLAYYNPSIGLAIGEKVKYAHATDPDIFTVNRYPYIVPKSSISGYYALGPAAEEYYYTEQEMLEAESP